MLALLNGFIIELREAGLPVSLTEHLDAMEAIKHIPLEDRSAFKYALAATLVKNNAHWRSSAMNPASSSTIGPPETAGSATSVMSRAPLCPGRGAGRTCRRPAP